jgi:hypothetical protein
VTRTTGALITGSQLDVYLEYSGDGDGWARYASDGEKSRIDDAQWAEIDLLRVELGLMKREQLAPAAKQKLLDSLAQRVADEDVLRRLLEVA